jgi:hypothetical protein
MRKVNLFEICQKELSGFFTVIEYVYFDVTLGLIQWLLVKFMIVKDLP